jgi:hypothetical protein
MVATDIVILASVVGFILTFFHWYGVTSSAGVSMTLNGWHGWGVAAAILFAIGALYSLGRAFGVTSGTNMRESALLTIIGVATIVCTVIFMLTEGSGYGAGYDKGPLYGAVVGLICAIVMTGGALLVAQESDT